MILKLTNYRICDTKERQQLKVKARTVAAVCGKPIYNLRELVHYLSEQHIVAPEYRFMQTRPNPSVDATKCHLLKIHIKRHGEFLTKYS
jgi:Domain of unknown function (DUF4158)